MNVRLTMEETTACLTAGVEEEGWKIATYRGHYQLQRDDDLMIFPSDADAWAFVWAKAQAGSPLHKDALEFLRKNEPTEYKVIAHFCEGV